ncbi:hypothetical protein [Micromonospora sp. DH14]|uniref:hypothetical protein n=1 Tax=Micromonospora sp. DH14 TaxID=3040120 RepID=UPI0024427F33|nr:hypothetical protein [Micromonospora sp. DH14]MDG9675587.1 hypothetical protein [Micromonospora sp. DH14]
MRQAEPSHFDIADIGDTTPDIGDPVSNQAAGRQLDNDLRHVADSGRHRAIPR